MRQADMELKKGQNIIEHEAEIYARPARTWFQSEKEKQNAKGKLIPPFSSQVSKLNG
jgi:ATP-dependent RNA helicase DDX27